MALAEEERNSGGNRQQERRLATRAKLVEAAIKLLNQKGAAQLTTEEVAREAGLTRGAIQYHFDSPKSLLIESIVEIADRLSQHLDVEPLLKLPLGERIDRVVDDYWLGFGGDTYAAFIEIAMRGRQDPDFESAITDALRELEKKRAGTWVKVFADTGKTKEEIMSLRSTLLIMLRGMALTNMIDNHRDIVAPQMDLFKDMFKKYLINS